MDASADAWGGPLSSIRAAQSILQYPHGVALAQFERDLIRERTRAGLQAAGERGRRGGRQAVVTPYKLARARQHLAAGFNF
ncbi:recombinase family protein, partial [Mesorhizobium zhangyense]|uniref:recombinase family protein n=1 Tax=Mesorhizobium zhangyense TaxID=1776730 RepID=UPI00406BC43E